MTSKAAGLERALIALVSAADKFHQHRLKRPDDRAGLCRLGFLVDESAKKIPAPAVQAIVRHLAETPMVSVSLD